MTTGTIETTKMIGTAAIAIDMATMATIRTTGAVMATVVTADGIEVRATKAKTKTNQRSQHPSVAILRETSNAADGYL
jgi:hypothetical protein